MWVWRRTKAMTRMSVSVLVVIAACLADAAAGAVHVRVEERMMAMVVGNRTQT
jgi:hypothetical protein